MTYIHLGISQESKLFLSLLIFVLGSKEMDSWCLSTCLFSVMEPKKQKAVSMCLYVAEVNIAFIFINDLSNPNGPEY